MLGDLTQYLWILWLALVVLFVVIELLTLEFTFLMIAAGSLLGGLGSNLLGWPWWVQAEVRGGVRWQGLKWAVEPVEADGDLQESSWCSPTRTFRAPQASGTLTCGAGWCMLLVS